MTSLVGFQYTPENMQRLEKVSLKNLSDTKTHMQRLEKLSLKNLSDTNTHSHPQSHLALLTCEAWARGPEDSGDTGFESSRFKDFLWCPSAPPATF